MLRILLILFIVNKCELFIDSVMAMSACSDKKGFVSHARHVSRASP